MKLTMLAGFVPALFIAAVCRDPAWNGAKAQDTAFHLPISDCGNPPEVPGCGGRQ
jgi:hypothetical protein